MTTPSARAMTEGTRPHAAAAPSRANGQYLYGVQGLRTFAALMAAVHHIWFHRVSGGVDVFFVVAGYFAAGSRWSAAPTTPSGSTPSPGPPRA